MKKSAFIFVAVALLALPLTAEGPTSQTTWGVDGAYKFAHNYGFGEEGFEFPDYSPETLPDDFTAVGLDEGRDLGSSWGGAQIQGWVNHRIILPFLQGDGPLTEGNNLTFNFKGLLSPVTLGGTATAVFTPAALFKLEAGVHLGTGWSMLGFKGLGLNNDGSGNPTEKPFDGLVAQVWGGGTFQFDLAAVMPGEWNHLVAVANGKLLYQHYTQAEKEDAWVYMADSGENFNGFRYLGTYFLGYQMPLKVNTVGVMMETKENLGDVRDLDPMELGGWGSDFREVRLGPLCNITLSENSSITLLLQFINERGYQEDSVFYNWFQNRSSDNTVFWRLERLAFSYSVKL